MARRYFTVEEANALLPRLSGIMQQVLQLHAHLRALAHALTEAGLPVTPATLSGQEPVDGGPEIERLYARARGFYETIREGVEGVHSLGAEVKDLETGLVDFYSLLDGDTEVLLCWRVGEPKITHFHLPDAGYAGRQPIEGHTFLAQPAPTVH